MKKTIKVLLVLSVFVIVMPVYSRVNVSSIRSLKNKIRRLRNRTISIRLTPVSKRRNSVHFRDANGDRLIVYVKTSRLRRKIRRMALNRTVVFHIQIRRTLRVDRRSAANYGMRGHTRIKMIVSTIDWE